MSPDPILAAPLIVKLHLVTAVPALALGPFALFRSRRDRLHKRLGYAWAVSMLALAASGLFIRSDFALIGPVGPIHVFSVLAIWGVLNGLRLIRRGDVQGHRAAMQSVWFGAIGVTGLLTLLPGRTLNRALFGESPGLAIAVIAAGLLGLVLLWRGRARGATAKARKIPS